MSKRHARSSFLTRRMILATGGLILLSVATLAAHDFWLVPVSFRVATGSDLEVLGQTGTRFPSSISAVAPERVAEARILTARDDERITDLSVREKSLMIRHRPQTAGQRVVGVSLASGARRVAVTGLKRYIALEGAPELAKRYEEDSIFPSTDSATQRSQKFAKTIVEVGEGGPRAFDRTLGHALEIVPTSDPSGIHQGQPLAVRVLYHGQPLANAFLRAGLAVTDTAAERAATPDTTVVTDGSGVARVVMASMGLWNVRLLHAAPAAGGAGEWEVFFATLVFGVGAGHDAQRNQPQ